MNKYLCRMALWAAVATGCLALNSCAENEIDQEISLNTMVVSATCQKAPATKVNYSDPQTMTWSTGDSFRIFNASNNRVDYSLQGDGGQASASFSGEYISHPNHAFFPASKAAETYEAQMLEMTGQVQMGNNSLAHLPEYTYMEGALTLTEDEAFFTSVDFSLLTAQIDFKLNFPQGYRGAVQSFEMCTADGEDIFTTARNINPEVLEGRVMSSSVMLEMRGIGENEKNVQGYLNILPVTVDGKDLNITVHTLHGEDVVDYEVTLSNLQMNFEAGHMYTLNLTMARAETEKGGPLVYPTDSYELSEDRTTLVKWKGSELAVDLRLDPAFSQVTNVAQSAFHGLTSLESVVLTDKITTMGSSVFGSCSNLKYAKLPKNLETVPVRTFYGCHKFSSVDMPESPAEIGDYAFGSCYLMTEIDLPESITSIGEYALSHCLNLLHVDVPENVTAIHGYAFNGSSKLETVDLPANLTTLGCYAFAGCSKLYKIVVPSGINIIHPGVFYYCTALKNVTLPDGITSLGWSSFAYSGIETIDLPSELTSLANYAFSSCVHLKYIDLPEKLETIGAGAFNYCSEMTKVTMHNNVTKITDAAFDHCGHLTEINLSEGITEIGERVFQTCYSLPQITIPADVTSIGDGAFRYCRALTSISFPNKLQTIGRYAFEECEALSGALIIPDNVESIGKTCFRKTNISSVKLSDKMTSIEESMFSVCFNLTSVDFPEQLKTIGEQAFFSCMALDNVVLPDGVKTIESGTFEACTHLKNIQLPGQLERVNRKAFNQCLVLEEITFPASFNYIEYGAFNFCQAMKTYRVLATTPPTMIYGAMVPNAGVVVYVPDNSVALYEAADEWKDFTIAPLSSEVP